MPETATSAMSPAEQEANAKRLAAEAAKFEAEAREFAAKARASEAQAEKYEIATRQEREKEAQRQASDEWNHVYRFDGHVDSGSVKKCMEKLTEWHRLDPTCDMEVVFSSPGGSIFDGMELFDHIVWLQKQGHAISTGGMGMAASMAGILTQAGNPRWMSAEGWLLIHRASFFAGGKTQDIEDQVRFVKRIEKRIIDIYVSRSDGKLTPQKIKANWKREDWWLNSDECLELGIIDEIRSSTK